jgi:hypothetical protein
MFSRGIAVKIELDMLLNKAATIKVKITEDGLQQPHHYTPCCKKENLFTKWANCPNAALW